MSFWSRNNPVVDSTKSRAPTFPPGLVNSTLFITPGCKDIYYAIIDYQWIDVTDLELGTYIFKMSINPEYNVKKLNIFNCIYTKTSKASKNGRLGCRRFQKSTLSRFPGFSREIRVNSGKYDINHMS